MTNSSKSAMRDHGATTTVALAMLLVYRKVISPMLLGIYGPACRFEPSCSEYAHQAIANHGVMRGSAMAARRLARCHPLGGHGYDPVPAHPTSGSEF